MLLRPSRSIRAKLALLIAASVSAAVALSFAVGAYRELSRFGEAKRAEIAATAEVLAAAAAEAVASQNRAAANRVINSIGKIPGVRFAEIRDADGALFAEAGTGVALLSSRTDDASLWSMLRDGSFFVTTAIMRGGRQVGSLGILVDTSELAERLREALAAAAWSAAAAILIGLLIASRLQRSITRPLGALARIMSDVRVTSDFTRRAERSSDDETGQLVDAFNDMLGQIENREAALEEHRAGLERTVEERTRDLAVARDVAETANRAKSDFLATMSHEIRTPMNGMLVMAELLAGTELPARQQRYAETIVRSGQTLLTIINDILDLSKIEAGKMELEQGRVALATLVDDVLGLFSERAASKHLDLAAEIAPDVPSVIEGDPVRLSQILSNLVNNALKFTETGHVKIVLQRLGGVEDRADLVIRVQDTGIGIAADKVDHIFEAFSQADQSTTRRFGGTGLGLSICQKLVAAMGGRIWAESVLGQGSTFAFTLQAPILEHPSAVASAARPRSAVLAVAAEATRAVIAAALAEWGCAVEAGGEPSWSEAGAADLVFAGPDWIERCTAEIAAAATRPTIICVAGFGNSKVDAMLATGLADGLLTQPVSSARVRDILAAIDAGSLASLLESRRGGTGLELPELRRLDVLVADDSAVNREVVTEALSRLGARTRTVEDGRQAVEAFRGGRFDVVLMDCSMPEMDGFEATRAIRAYEAERGRGRTPVVALTAHMAGGTADSWREAGMDDYLSKPFTMRSLADCLARWQPEGAAPAAAEPEAASAQGPGDEAESSPLDLTVLNSLRTIAGGSNAMLEKIFGLFQAHGPARFAALQAALAAGDLARTASEAHALKSPSLNIGALRLGALCSEIEARARAEDPGLTSAALDPIETELHTVLAAIERECGHAPVPARPAEALAS